MANDPIELRGSPPPFRLPTSDSLASVHHFHMQFRCSIPASLAITSGPPTSRESHPAAALGFAPPFGNRQSAFFVRSASLSKGSPLLLPPPYPPRCCAKSITGAQQNTVFLKNFRAGRRGYPCGNPQFVSAPKNRPERAETTVSFMFC